VTRRLAAAAVLVVMLAAPAPVAAQTTAYSYGLRNVAPATTAGADRLLRAAFTAADARWKAAGRPLPCPVDLYLYDADDHTDMRAPDRERSCLVFVDRHYRDHVWKVANNPREHRNARLDELEALCAAAVHDRGHNLGLLDLTDAPANIMQSESSNRVIPARCQRWAARTLPPRKVSR
jgi:hypothetical protein